MMSLSEFANQIRRHDWTAVMSDDSRVFRRAKEKRSRMQVVATQSRNHKRLWTLGSTWHQNFMWEPEGSLSEGRRFEQGWRWVGAYLWVHGVQVTPEQAQALVHPCGGDLTGTPRWGEIDLFIAEGERVPATRQDGDS